MSDGTSVAHLDSIARYLTNECTGQNRAPMCVQHHSTTARRIVAVALRFVCTDRQAPIIGVELNRFLGPPRLLLVCVYFFFCVPKKQLVQTIFIS
jgi:hypothetical protein